MAPSCQCFTYGDFQAIWCVTSRNVLLPSLPFQRVLSSNAFHHMGECYRATCRAQIYNLPITSLYLRRRVCYARSQMVDTGGSQDGFSSKDRAKQVEVGTRLSRFTVSLWRSFIEKLAKARKNAPMKILSLLLGYYSANALSTLVGQTGDWDIIVVGIAVAFMEGISFLAYRLPAMLSKFEEFLSMLNFWKVGLSLGFILDKFKLDSGLFDF
eukprot:c29215_g1_i1 orf=184-819(+)